MRQPELALPDPDSFTVATSDLKGTLAQYAAMGFAWDNVFVGKFYPRFAGTSLYAVHFWRQKPRLVQSELAVNKIPLTP